MDYLQYINYLRYHLLYKGYCIIENSNIDSDQIRKDIFNNDLNFDPIFQFQNKISN